MLRFDQVTQFWFNTFLGQQKFRSQEKWCHNNVWASWQLGHHWLLYGADPVWWLMDFEVRTENQPVNDLNLPIQWKMKHHFPSHPNFLIHFHLKSMHGRVPHFAKHWRIFSATSFLGAFYLVMKENAKKVGKSWHLGVQRHPPWFMYCASLLYSIWIWPFEFNI